MLGYRRATCLTTSVLSGNLKVTSTTTTRLTIVAPSFLKALVGEWRGHLKVDRRWWNCQRGVGDEGDGWRCVWVRLLATMVEVVKVGRNGVLLWVVR